MHNPCGIYANLAPFFNIFHTFFYFAAWSHNFMPATKALNFEIRANPQSLPQV